LIEDGARRALADLSAVRPYDPGRPCTIEVEYKTTAATDRVRRVRGLEVVDDRRIRSTADTWWSAWQQFFFFD
jgi:D-amino peptidase